MADTSILHIILAALAISVIPFRYILIQLAKLSSVTPEANIYIHEYYKVDAALLSLSLGCAGRAFCNLGMTAGSSDVDIFMAAVITFGAAGFTYYLYEMFPLEAYSGSSLPSPHKPLRYDEILDAGGWSDVAYWLWRCMI
ncbi:hypothetical protein EDB81DRAFT_203097 [Dactylonectria macrodidyma]|uniref:Uncharacterized protein n=1 Tax=Dactylonectria macrodidyma TaxID=307937 RepID=A0A9P9DVK1_9HYPO|nr:hypothetical protein EDB81DRAFT_203097 [Dactylonectria macrodidyma]